MVWSISSDVDIVLVNHPGHRLRILATFTLSYKFLKFVLK
jgi:hypothetical protein